MGHRHAADSAHTTIRRFAGRHIPRYGDLAYQYADIFSLVTLEEWKAPGAYARASSWTEQKRLSKLRREQFRTEVLDRLQRTYDLPRVVQMAPEIMHDLFQPFWRLHQPLAYLRAYASYVSITPPPRPSHIPFDDYLAVRFYTSSALPEENRAFVQEVIERIGRHFPVVLLNQPYSVDGHFDLGTGTVYAFGDTMPLVTNLETQASVIGHARAFIGTFGGLSYLAPFLGVPSVGVHSELSASRLAKPSHRLVKADLDAATHVFAELNRPCLVFDAKIGAEKLIRRVAKQLGW